jgi:hypothetical protein
VAQVIELLKRPVTTTTEMKTRLKFKRLVHLATRQLPISLISLLCGLSGCAPNYYFNSSQNVNVFGKRGDVHVSLGMDDNQAGGSVGYAVTDNIGFIGSMKGFNLKEVIIADSSKGGLFYVSWLVEPELVLTKRLHLGGTIGSNIAGSLNLGYAFAGGLTLDKDIFSLNFSRLALQPAISYSTDYFDIALSTRFSRLDYNLQWDQTPPSGDPFDLRDIGKQPYNFIEPAITIGGGYKFVKLRVQYLLAKKQNDASLRYLSESVYVSLNITFNSKKPSR